MILLTILGIIMAVAFGVIIVAALIGGVSILVMFGDVIIFGLLIAWIIKLIVRRRRRGN